jgi:hypothetical protein
MTSSKTPFWQVSFKISKTLCSFASPQASVNRLIAQLIDIDKSKNN